MNCPACGHPADEHDGFGCHHAEPGKRCMCKVNEHKLLKTERDAYKVEALAARDLLNVIEKDFIPETFGDLINFVPKWQAYLAARVPDEPKETP